MRIGMILDEEFPPDPRVENEAEALIKDGHEIVLFCFNYSEKIQKEEIYGIKVRRYKTAKYIRRISALAYTIPLYNYIVASKIKHFLKAENPDVIHVHDIRVARAVELATRKIKIPKIIDLHENRPEIMKYYHHVKNFPGNILIYPSVWKKWEERFVSGFDRVVVVTDEAKQYLVDNYKIPSGKVAVFPNTVKPSFYNSFKLDDSVLNKFSNNFVLFYFGDTGLRRGLGTAIRAMPELVKKISNLRLVIVGSGKGDYILKNLVDGLKVNDYVCFEGYKDVKLLQSYITASNICISPLHRNIHHDTTFANKLFQYMSLGKPVLVSDCTSQKNVVEKAKAGLVHEAENYQDFTRKVLQFYEDSELAEKSGKNGASFVRNYFNQDITSYDLTSHYKNLKI